ncbi:hypothetical protein ACPPVO_27435 [Dactylosporangium sp. McL0621]|uniref:hypothetical protein n=1 Tax=Dactylosporangium sp. McL0621 TaxID=3415678 RepID=UPI003CF9FA38
MGQGRLALDANLLGHERLARVGDLLLQQPQLLHQQCQEHDVHDKGGDSRHRGNGVGLHGNLASPC